MIRADTPWANTCWRLRAPAWASARFISAPGTFRRCCTKGTMWRTRQTGRVQELGWDQLAFLKADLPAALHPVVPDVRRGEEVSWP
jgi:hypothetical protein